MTLAVTTDKLTLRNFVDDAETKGNLIQSHVTFERREFDVFEVFQEAGVVFRAPYLTGTDYDLLRLRSFIDIGSRPGYGSANESEAFAHLTNFISSLRRRWT